MIAASQPIAVEIVLVFVWAIVIVLGMATVLALVVGLFAWFFGNRDLDNLTGGGGTGAVIGFISGIAIALIYIISRLNGIH